MRAILFDLYGLFMKLQTAEGQAEIARAAKISAHGISHADFFRVYREERDDLDAGRVSFAEYVARMGARFGVEFTDVEAIEAADNASWFAHDSDMIAWADELVSSGVQVGLLSNIPTALSRLLVEAKPWLSLFEPRLFSCDLGLHKPETEIYTTALAAMGRTPEEVLFLDDTPRNLPAAEALGIHVHLFTGIDDAKRAVADFLAEDPEAETGSEAGSDA